MPMTRELKKRFMGIDDRIEKLEKRKPAQRTNGEDVSDSPGDVEERLDTIEMVLQIPGPTDGETQVLSAWRQIIEGLMVKLEDRLLQVELRASWTPAEGKTLDVRVKNLWGRPSTETIRTVIEERLTKLEQTPDGQADLTDLKERVHDLEVKPVAGNLSQFLQDMDLSLEGTNREMKELKGKNSLVHLLLLALIIPLWEWCGSHPGPLPISNPLWWGHPHGD